MSNSLDIVILGVVIGECTVIDCIDETVVMYYHPIFNEVGQCLFSECPKPLNEFSLNIDTGIVSIWNDTIENNIEYTIDWKKLFS
jgi:hypothetical protein